MRVALVAFVALLAGCREAPAPRETLAKARETTENLFDLRVPPRAPSPNGKAPALVLIHGLGSNEQDLVGLARRFDPRIDLHSLRAPIAQGPGSFAWFHVTFTADGPRHDSAEAEAARAKIVTALKGLHDDPSIDPGKIYLLGFSQGAMLGLSVAYTEPALVAGVIAISGRTLPEVAASVNGKTIASGPRVLLMHGTEDRKLPYAHALASEQVLKAAGLAYDFKSYPVGHTIDEPMRADIATWLSAQLGSSP